MKKPIATILCAALVLAGCGSSAKSTSSTSTSTAASAGARAQACRNAEQAKAQFVEAAKEVRLQLTKKELFTPVIAAMSNFRAKVRALQSVSDQQRALRLGPVLEALGREETVLEDLGRGDLKAAGQAATGVNHALEHALAELQSICSKA